MISSHTLYLLSFIGQWTALSLSGKVKLLSWKITPLKTTPLQKRVPNLKTKQRKKKHDCWIVLRREKKSVGTQGARTCQTDERWEVFKRALCQQKQLVCVWTRCWRNVLGNALTENTTRTKCQIYLTANSFLWSGTEYVKRIFFYFFCFNVSDRGV